MRLFCTAWALAAGSLLACASTATATMITPTTTTDDVVNNGNCTLREAIQAADTDAKVDQCPAGSSADVIRLGAHTYTVSGHLDITAPMTIVGAGSAPTTIDAGGRDRVFVIGADAPTTLQALTLTGGHPVSGALGAPGENGGAIEASSPLTLTNVNVNASSAGDGSAAGSAAPGGAGANGSSGGDGGGIWSNAALTITGGSFTSDHAGNGSAGLNGGDASTAGGAGGVGGNGGAGGPGGSGGAIAAAGGAQLTITGATFSNDSAGVGGAGGNGGAGAPGSGGAGGAGGAGGNGGSGGAGGAISAGGIANVSAISTGQTSAGPGGVGGVGGRGGAGTTVGADGGNGTSGDGGSGGAVSAGSALLVIAGSTLTSGSAGPGGDGPSVSSAASAGETRAGGPGSGGNGGAVSSAGMLSIDHTTMSFDHAGAGGAGGSTLIRAYPGGPGGSGGAVDGGVVTIENSRVTGSAAGAGGAGGSGITSAAGGPGGGGGGVHARGGLLLDSSTYDHDAAGTGGAGAAATSSHAAASGGNGGAGGAVLADADGTIANTTMFADKAGDGGAGGGGSGAQPGAAGGAGGDGGSVRGPSASLILIHLTVVGGAPGAGGAGAGSAPAGATGGVATAGIVAASVLSGNAGPQCSGAQNGGGNVNVPDSSCGGLVADPQLGPFDSNGGPAQTFLPAPSSPVIDLIAPGSAACTINDPDERGAARPQGPKCDSGAVEAANPALSAVPSPVSFNSLPSGRSVTKTITIHASFDPVAPAASLIGPDARAFSIGANRCSGRTLAPLGACTLLVTFRSSGARGARHATLHVAHDRAGPPLDLPISATVGASAPVISRLSLSNPTFAVMHAVTSRVNAKRTTPKGTIIAFRLSEPATVRFSVEQRAPGRLRHKRCVAPSSALAKAKRCTRTIVHGTFSRRRAAGINHVVFTGRFRRGALPPGRYTLVLAPTAFGRVRGRSRTIGFTIVRG